MYKLNPATGEKWKHGEIREDGFVFCNYTKTRPTKDGYDRLIVSDPEKRARSRKKSAKARYSRSTEWINEYKLTQGGCVDCGYNAHPAALDFDHMPGTEKKFNIGQFKWKSRSVLLEEIAKCELVCANCHRIRTVNRHANQ